MGSTLDGKPVVLSDPIEHEFDAFVGEVTNLLKYPVRPGEENVMKECLVTEEGPDKFTVKVILSGEKLSKWGFGNPDDPSKDRITHHTVVTINREARWLETIEYTDHWAGEKDDNILHKAHADFLKDPMRLEYYWTMADGERRANEEIANLLQGVVDLVMVALANRPVKVELDSSKQSIVSQPVPEDVTGYDAFFDGLVAALKEGPPGAQIEELSETKVKLGPPEGTEPPIVSMTMSWDKDKGFITQETERDGEMLFKSFYSITQSPVVFECWSEGPQGKRITGQSHARPMQVVVDKAIAKAKGGSWFGW